MGRRRLLLLLKPLDAYSIYLSNAASPSTNPKVLSFLDNRCKVHRDAIEFCQNILRRKPVDWDATFRSNLSQPIHDVDLVVTVGGDGTLLQASHLLNDSIPLLGVNSDPTQPHEVQEFGNEFDATRSTGYLCAATIKNFEQILNNILEGRIVPSELSRMSIKVNSMPLSTYALNDILIADPCPASASRRRIRKDGQASLPLTNCRSSGLRVSTAAGSTAAMLSAGGFQMPILSTDLQYMVREPISPTSASLSLMHGLVKPNETMDIDWYTNEGLIYVDGHRNTHPVQHGDTIQSVSSCGLLAILMKRKLRDRSLPKKKLRDSIMCSLAIHRGKNGSAKQGRLRCKGVTKQIIGVVPKGLALRVVLVDLHSKDESGKGFKLEVN
ncbi:NADH kinase [Tanacetum coccineum]